MSGRRKTKRFIQFLKSKAIKYLSLGGKDLGWMIALLSGHYSVRNYAKKLELVEQNIVDSALKGRSWQNTSMKCLLSESIEHLWALLILWFSQTSYEPWTEFGINSSWLIFNNRSAMVTMEKGLCNLPCI